MKERYVLVKVPKRTLKYGKKYGVTRQEAEKAYIQGFMKSARKERKTKYKGIAGFDFEWG